MNNYSVIGRVGRDSEHRYTPSGKPVLSWKLAVDSGYGESKQTLWLDCALWGDRGQKLVEHIKKGLQLGVSGELGTREHEGKTYLKLNVRDVTLCGSKPSDAAKPAKQQPRPAGNDEPEDEVPF